MWFELIPSGTIVMLAMAAPSYALYGIHKVWLNNGYARTMDQRWDRLMYARDFLLTGDAYTSRGLEAIPDEGAPIDNPKQNRKWPLLLD